MLIQTTHETYGPRPREPPHEVSTCYDQILLVQPLYALHNIEPSTSDHLQYHTIRQDFHAQICDLLFEIQSIEMLS